MSCLLSRPQIPACRTHCQNASDEDVEFPSPRHSNSSGLEISIAPSDRINRAISLPIEYKGERYWGIYSLATRVMLIDLFTSKSAASSTKLGKLSRFVTIRPPDKELQLR